jgi:hypothetical protein
LIILLGRLLIIENRTLDQAYYYMLSDTQDRDSDQVVTRRARKEAGEFKTDISSSERHMDRLSSSSGSGDGTPPPKVLRHNILMVDQLWLWCVKARKNSGQPDILITSFPSREGVRTKDSRTVDDLQASILRVSNQAGHSRGPILSTRDLISRVINVCCKTMEKTQDLQSVEFFHMFQSTIGDAVSKMTKAMARPYLHKLIGIRTNVAL